jgi:hypothetical protein
MRNQIPSKYQKNSDNCFYFSMELSLIFNFDFLGVDVMSDYHTLVKKWRALLNDLLSFSFSFYFYFFLSLSIFPALKSIFFFVNDVYFFTTISTPNFFVSMLIFSLGDLIVLRGLSSETASN